MTRTASNGRDKATDYTVRPAAAAVLGYTLAPTEPFLNPQPATASPAAPAERLLALDVFRGLTMAAMVIVNNPGDWGHVYWPLLHAEWHGWTPTDLIFPFFLFIVGVSLTLSSRTLDGFGPILRRTVVIFGLGLLLALFPRFAVARLRWPGVLQRIAVCYVATTVVYRLIAAGGASRARQATRLAMVTVVLLSGYWAVMMLVPVPGGAAGDLSPEGNLAAWLDRAVLPGRLWQRTWDPEGLLSTVPAIGTTILGVLAGLWLREAGRSGRAARGLLLAGVAGVVIGELWGLAFPINKNLWTSSYVVFTAGGASLLLGALLWVIDVRGLKGWTRPFVVLGTNAITLFVLSGLLVKTLILLRVPTGNTGSIPFSEWIYQFVYVPLASPHNASLAYALTHLAVLYLVLAWMYHRRVFLKA